VTLKLSIWNSVQGPREGLREINSKVHSWNSRISMKSFTRNCFMGLSCSIQLMMILALNTVMSTSFLTCWWTTEKVKSFIKLSTLYSVRN
jgi:hypothetical protein